MSSVTELLNTAGENRQASEDLLPLVYGELRRLASQRLSQEKPGQTLQATALVHEAYLRMIGDDAPSWEGRGHFFAAAAEAMRRILVEAARRKGRVKHGGGVRPFSLEGRDVAGELPSDDILDLDEVLPRLEAEEPEAARIVNLHFFAGLPIEEAAEMLGISRATAYRQWTYARAWLRCELDGEKT